MICINSTIQEKTGETDKVTRQYTGLMKDEVPQQCRSEQGVDTYCLTAILYGRVQQIEQELCRKDNTYAFCR